MSPHKESLIRCLAQERLRLGHRVRELEEANLKLQLVASQDRASMAALGQAFGLLDHALLTIIQARGASAAEATLLDIGAQVEHYRQAMGLFSEVVGLTYEEMHEGEAMP